MVLNRKAKGFTLIEILIAIIISLILISLTTNSYLLFTNYFSRMENSYKTKKELFCFYEVFFKDWENSTRISQARVNSISLERISKSSLQYDFIAKCIIRIDGKMVDTFEVENIGIACGYYKNSDLIDSLNVQLVFECDTFNFLFKKSYLSDRTYSFQ